MFNFLRNKTHQSLAKSSFILKIIEAFWPDNLFPLHYWADSGAESGPLIGKGEDTLFHL